MPIVVPPEFPPVSTPPTTEDPANFDPRMDTWLTEQTTIIRPSLIAIGSATYQNALESKAQAEAATESAAEASTQAGLAEDAKDAAQAAAQGAVLAPGTSGTSSSSVAVGLGTKTFTTQTGKNFVSGMNVVAARASDPVAVRMSGTLQSYNSGTGEFVMAALKSSGSGTFSNWVLSLSGEAGPADMIWTPVTGTTHTSSARQELALRNVNATTVTLNGSPVDGERLAIHIENSRYDNVVARNGKTIMGYADDLQLNDPAVLWQLVYSSTENNWRVIA